ncbi:hypothetical protein [Fischerella thermalis]|uniref:hypothetical protein n=1 Tax=Fischerella thermalis TaxID=372787 RepID=UPI00307D29FC
MNEEIKSIGIYPEYYEFESDYIPLISFKTQQQKDTIEDYILTKADIFFKKIIKINIDVEASQITYHNTITEKDFRSKNISYFYENIFFDLDKRDSDNKLDFSPKWGITFDEKIAPIEVSFLSPTFRVYSDSRPIFKPFYYDHLDYKWNYRYGTIDINGTPVFYYIYFTLQELLDVIKKYLEY